MQRQPDCPPASSFASRNVFFSQQPTRSLLNIEQAVPFPCLKPSSDFPSIQDEIPTFCTAHKALWGLGIWKHLSPFSSLPAHSEQCSVSSLCSVNTPRLPLPRGLCTTLPSWNRLPKIMVQLLSHCWCHLLPSQRGLPCLERHHPLPVTAHHTTLLSLPYSPFVTEIICIVCPLVHCLFSTLECKFWDCFLSLPNPQYSPQCAYIAHSRCSVSACSNQVYYRLLSPAVSCRTVFPGPMTFLREQFL